MSCDVVEAMDGLENDYYDVGEATKGLENEL